MMIIATSIAPSMDSFGIEAFIALVALTLMEIVLGIDNLVFIAIKTSGLPAHRRPWARRFGLLAALGTRLLLLYFIKWIAELKNPIFHISDFLVSDLFASITSDEEINAVSWRDLLLLGGGLFLLWTAVREIHDKIEKIEDGSATAGTSFAKVIVTIAVMDIVFSIDSVLTAVGLANQYWVMATAVIISVIVMIIFANQISDFVEDNPTIKMLALSFLLLIGLVLVTEAVGHPLSKGYIYFAMGFSLMVEIFNMRFRRRQQSVTTSDASS